MTETTERKALMTKKKIVKRALIFILIAGLLFVYLNEVFTISNSDASKKIFNAFYAEEENSLDAVYFGTSATNRYFISPKAYNDEGMAIFDLAVMGMPLFFVPTLIDEVEKTQNPRLYIIELRWMLKDQDVITDAHIRRVTDSMKYSSNRSAAIEKALEFTKGADGELSDVSESKLDYYVPIIKYHSRLSAGDLGIGDVLLLNSKNKSKGFVVGPKTGVQAAQEEPLYSDDKGTLSDEAEETLYEVLDKCDELKDKDILFVLAPYSMKEGQAEKFNTVVDIVKARGYDVLNFNTQEMAEALDINWDKDFYNSKHVNFIGAEKYTEYLTEYISDNYNMPDHRGDSKYKSWEKAYRYYLNYIAKFEDEMRY